MLHPARKPLLRRSISDIEVSGFNLMELLVVMCILGLLAGILVFALGGTASAGSIASCGADSRVINQAAQALVVENPSDVPTTAQAWKLALLGRVEPGVWTTVESGAPFLQSWPESSKFTFSIAGVGAVATTGDVPSVSPANGDVIVKSFAPGLGTRTFDTSINPTAGCSGA
jgi:prepilin-type N-terminal cleavage/methylation domain-containing protein